MNLALRHRPAEKPSAFDENTLKAIHDKRQSGKALTASEKETISTAANAVIDTLEIEGNAALSAIFKKMFADGALTAVEQEKLYEALSPVPALPQNPELDALLTTIRGKGAASDADVDKIIKATGKLSSAEDDAIYGTLAALAVAGGISPEGAQKISSWMDEQRIQREKHTLGQVRNKALKRLGMTLGAIATLAAVFALTPVGGALVVLGGVGATAAKLGIATGGVFGAIKASEKMGESNDRKISNYGVRD